MQLASESADEKISLASTEERLHFDFSKNLFYLKFIRLTRTFVNNEILMIALDSWSLLKLSEFQNVSKPDLHREVSPSSPLTACACAPEVQSPSSALRVLVRTTDVVQRRIGRMETANGLQRIRTAGRSIRTPSSSMNGPAANAASSSAVASLQCYGTMQISGLRTSKNLT